MEQQMEYYLVLINKIEIKLDLYKIVYIYIIYIWDYRLPIVGVVDGLDGLIVGTEEIIEIL